MSAPTNGTSGGGPSSVCSHPHRRSWDDDIDAEGEYDDSASRPSSSRGPGGHHHHHMNHNGGLPPPPPPPIPSSHPVATGPPLGSMTIRRHPVGLADP
ncbi:hypothetical protein AN958_06266 [Leucoagaricus sp. SymC.cos]|nr:hypothetical protein AN958_06266 [Leucoagaricus sp. SymC.cos]